MKKLILLFILLFLSTATSASIVNFNFDTTQNVTQENPGIIYASSLVLQVQTSEHVLCRYSQNAGTPFDSMEGSFDDNLETIHKKALTDLQDKVHRYFIRCRDMKDLGNTLKGQNELEAIFKTSRTISGQVILNRDILNSGKHELTLITTKIPITKPKLTYSYDGIVYEQIILQGSQTNWKGYIIISESLGEKIGSFRFEATDLEGRVGAEIIGKNIFMVDTSAPSSISSIEAIGEYKQIRLKWTYKENEEIKTINIYRSENPNVGYTDFYKSLEASKEIYVDNDVSSGKTYYYKIAPEDLAGNIADLSKELSATSRTDNKTTTTGLSSSLVGSVDAVLTEISILENDILKTETELNNLGESEKSQIKKIGLFEILQNSKSELSALKRETENYKLQDLTSEVLNSRISSSRVKINIIKKKTPETVNSIDSSEKEVKPTEESLRLALLEYSSELSSSIIDNSIKKSQNLIEENNVKIKTQINIFEIIFLDGTRQTTSLIQHSIDSTLEKSENYMILLKIPSIISAESLDIKNLEYTEESEGLIRFETDTKQITYVTNSKLETNVINEINIALLEIAQDSPALTGYFLSEIPNTGSFGITFLIILVCALTGYLIIIKQQQEKDSVISFIEKARTVKNLKKNGQEQEANQLYKSLQLDYVALSQEEKEKVFKKIKSFANK